MSTPADNIFDQFDAAPTAGAPASVIPAADPDQTAAPHNVFDKFDTPPNPQPVVVNTAPKQTVAASPAAPANIFDQFDTAPPVPQALPPPANPATLPGTQVTAPSTGASSTEAHVTPTATLTPWNRFGLPSSAAASTAQATSTSDNQNALNDTEVMQSRFGKLASTVTPYIKRPAGFYPSPAQNPVLGAISKPLDWINNILNPVEQRKAQAWVAVTAQQSGMTVNQLRASMGGSSDIPDQAASALVSTATLGVLNKEQTPDDSAAAQIARAAGNLGGFVLGPYAGGKSLVAPLAKYFDVAATDGRVVALAKDMARSGVTMGAASGLSATSQAVHQDTVSQALSTYAQATVSGVENGLVFGVTGRVLPKNNTLSFLGRAALINTGLDTINGTSPLDHRPLQVKVFNALLNTVFAAHGADSEVQPQAVPDQEQPDTTPTPIQAAAPDQGANAASAQPTPTAPAATQNTSAGTTVDLNKALQTVESAITSATGPSLDVLQQRRLALREALGLPDETPPASELPKTGTVLPNMGTSTQAPAPESLSTQEQKYLLTNTVDSQQPVVKPVAISTPPEPTAPANTAAFLNPHEQRVSDYTQQAQAQNLTPPQTAAFMPQDVRDPVTGFFPASDRIPTLLRAQQYAKDTGRPVVYTEFDLPGLGAANAALGHTQADAQFYTPTARAFEQNLQQTGATVVPFRRTQGDEGAAIVVGATPEQVQDALTRAEAAAHQIAAHAGIAAIPNAKHPGAFAGGLYTAMQQVHPDTNLDALHSDIDSQIENRKNVNRSQTGTPAPLTLGEQAIRPQDGATQAPTRGGPQTAPLTGRTQTPPDALSGIASDAAKGQPDVASHTKHTKVVPTSDNASQANTGVPERVRRPYGSSADHMAEHLGQLGYPVADEHSGNVDNDQRLPNLAETHAADSGRIDDFGEKIGGARKDTSIRTGTPPKVKLPDDATATGERRYIVSESASGPDKGGFVILDTKRTDFAGRPRLASSEHFGSRQEAEDAVPLVAVARNHFVRNSRANPEQYSIYRTINDHKRVELKTGFASQAEAMRHLAEHAREIAATRTNGGEELLPKPEKVTRVGPERRQNDSTPSSFHDAFGFRGVEFGNWNSRDERQEVMNHAYDGLHDLAEVLHIPPKAISLNGELALAFGARGQGLTGARAHYESQRAVINLTKMQGAGSLAHEWFHALDHYMARLDGQASGILVKNAEGHKVFNTHGNEFESYGVSRETKMRPELVAAWRKLMNVISHKYIQRTTDGEQAEKFVARTKENLGQHLSRIRQDLSTTASYGLRKAPASAAQLAEFDALAKKITDGESLEFKIVHRAGSRSTLAMRSTNDTLEQMGAILKAVRGRSGLGEHGVLTDMHGAMHSYRTRLLMLKEAHSGVSHSQEMPTSYRMEAVKADQGRGSAYWAKPNELAARAFSSYVEDRLAAEDKSSDFLSYGSNEHYVLALPENPKPFPGGEERQNINHAFDEFFATVKHTADDKGNVAMYSRTPSTQAGYEQRIDALTQGARPQRPGVRVLDHSDVLKMLGYGDEPVHLEEGKVQSGMYLHHLTAADWKRVPDWLEHPVAVFDSETVPGRLVFLAPDTKDGAPIRLIVDPHADGVPTSLHLLVNAYDAKGRNPMRHSLDDGLLRYVDKKEAHGWLSRSGLQLPGLLSPAHGLNGRIFTERDLVKARTQEPHAHQSVIHGASLENTVAGLIGTHEGAFKYPRSHATTLEGTLHDLAPVARMVDDKFNPALRTGRADQAWEITTPKGHHAWVYRKRSAVWINVAQLHAGDDGDAIYTAAEDFAHNTHGVFIGDTDGLSDVALRRRTEHMLSSAVKWSTTRHLDPHSRQVLGDASLGVPGLRWTIGDDAGNLESLQRVSHANTLHEFPELRTIGYNTEQERYERLGKEYTDDDFDRLTASHRTGIYGQGLRQSGPTPLDGEHASQGRSAGLPVLEGTRARAPGADDTRMEAQPAGVEARGTPDAGVRVEVRQPFTGEPTAGRNTLKRAVLLHTMATRPGSFGPEVLARLGQRLPASLLKHYYSKSDDGNTDRTGANGEAGIAGSHLPDERSERGEGIQRTLAPSSQDDGRGVRPAPEAPPSQGAHLQGNGLDGLPTTRTLAAGKLQRLLAERGLRAPHFAEIKPDVQPADLRAALEAVHAATDVRISVVRALTHEDTFNGVSFGQRHIFVDADAPHPVTTVVLHEFAHELEQSHPELWRPLATEIDRQGLLDAYIDKMRRAGYTHLSRADAVRELTSDAVGDAFTDQKFLEQLAQRNPSVFKRIVDTFTAFLNRLRGHLPDFQSNHYLKDVQAFHQKLLDVLDKYPGNREIDEEHFPPRYSRDMRDDLPQDPTAENAAKLATGTDVPAPTRRAALRSTVSDWMGRLKDSELGRAVQDLRHGAQQLAAPLSLGTPEAAALAKAFANMKAENLARWNDAYKNIQDRFTPEQRARMFEALSNENVSHVTGVATEEGLASLSPEERAMVDKLQAENRVLVPDLLAAGVLKHAFQIYDPRFIAQTIGEGHGSRVLNPLGHNLRLSTKHADERQHLTADETEQAAQAMYGKDAHLVRDIAVLPYAMKQLRDILANKTLIQSVKDYGAKNGLEMVVRDDERALNAAYAQYKTIDAPAFREYTPVYEERNGKLVPALNDQGQPKKALRQLWIHPDLEAPLKVVLADNKHNAITRALLNMKAKSMSAIIGMFPPVHRSVIFFKTITAFPGTLLSGRLQALGEEVRTGELGGIPFASHNALKDALVNIGKTGEIRRATGTTPEQLRAEKYKLVRAGLRDVGARGWAGSLDDIENSAKLDDPGGHSWTAQLLGLGAKAAGAPVGRGEEWSNLVKSTVDQVGHLWHSKWMWEKVANTQFGIARLMAHDLIAKGVSEDLAYKTAAEIGNRFAGAIPHENMGNGMRTALNLSLFSNSFNMTNMGIYKDATKGLPNYLKVDQPGMKTANTVYRRTMQGALARDIIFYLASQSALQSAIAYFTNRKTGSEIADGYLRRWHEYVSAGIHNPLRFLDPNTLSAASENEPGKTNRVFVGIASDGTGIYLKSPVGKIGEDLLDATTSPLELLKRKLSPQSSALMGIIQNDKGFDRQIYDPNGSATQSTLSVLKYLASEQVPTQLWEKAYSLVTGADRTTANLAAVVGAPVGLSFSRGYPGGPAAGYVAAGANTLKFAQQQILPDARRMLRNGQTEQAVDMMEKANMAPKDIQWVMRSTLMPRLSRTKAEQFLRTASPQARATFMRDESQPRG